MGHSTHHPMGVCHLFILGHDIYTTYYLTRCLQKPMREQGHPCFSQQNEAEAWRVGPDYPRSITSSSARRKLPSPRCLKRPPKSPQSFSITPHFCSLHATLPQIILFVFCFLPLENKIHESRTHIWPIHYLF